MRYIWLFIAALLAGADRLTKWAVVANMELKDKIHIIKIGDTEVLNIYYCLNDGAAFSELSGHRVLLITVTSVILAGVLGLMLSGKIKRPVYLAAAGLTLGGGVGNLIDRIFNGGLVVDFIDFSLINFPVFNVADICAVCGAGLLLATVVYDELRELKAKKAAKAAGAAGIANTAGASNAANTAENGDNGEL